MELKGSKTEANLMAALAENHRHATNILFMPAWQSARDTSR